MREETRQRWVVLKGLSLTITYKEAVSRGKLIVTLTQFFSKNFSLGLFPSCLDPLTCNFFLYIFDGKMYETTCYYSCKPYVDKLNTDTKMKRNKKITSSKTKSAL